MFKSLIKSFIISLVLAVVILFSLNRCLAETSQQTVFTEVIQPFLERWFIDHAVEISLEDNIKIERKLIEVSLIKFENVEGQERYSVNILFHVVVNDGVSGISLQGTKEQQVIFLLKDNNIIAYFPIDEYWKEKPRIKHKGIKLYI